MSIRILFLFSAGFLPALLAGQTLAGARSAAIAQSYTLEAAGRYDSAAAVLLAAGPAGTDYFLNLRLGWLASLRKDWPAAVQYYRAAGEAEPKSIEAKVGLLYTLRESGSASGMFETARELLMIDPGNAEAHRSMIEADLKIQEVGRAELRALDALRWRPIDLTLNILLARIYLRQERKADAQRVAGFLQAIYGRDNADVASLVAAVQ